MEVVKAEEPRRARKGEAILWVQECCSSQTDECILWPFSRGKQPRPVFNTGTTTPYVQSYICTEVNGQRPEGWFIRATCGSGLCGNPRHLEWSQTSNGPSSSRGGDDDGVRRKRQPKTPVPKVNNDVAVGPRLTAAEQRRKRRGLSPRDQMEVRRLHRAGVLNDEIAFEFDLAIGEIASILR